VGCCKIGNARNRALHPLSQAVDIVHVDTQKQGGEGTCNKYKEHNSLSLYLEYAFYNALLHWYRSLVPHGVRSTQTKASITNVAARYVVKLHTRDVRNCIPYICYRTPLFDTKGWLLICSFVPIQHCVLISVIQALEYGHKMFRHLSGGATRQPSAW
jgi:hypothetical protein